MRQDRFPDELHSSAHSESEIDVAASKLNELQAARSVNWRKARQLRVLFSCLLVLFVWLHRYLLGLNELGWGLGLFLTSMSLYTTAAWWLLKHRRQSAGFALLALDVFFLVWAIYLTGGPSSWLIVVLPLRTADQMTAGFSRCLFFAHWTTLSYLGMLMWIVWVEAGIVSWPLESFKTLLLYGVNLYLVYHSRFFDRRHRLTLDWIRLSKRLLNETREQATELENARIKAQVANKAKSDFLANISHELRTPMNAVMGMADLVALHRLEKAQRMRMNVLRECAADLQDVIENLLDFSQIEAESLNLELRSCDVAEVVRGVLKRLEPRARSKGINLETVQAEDLPQHLLLDPLRMRQLLLHLTDNAIKFTDSGTITVRLRAEERDFEATLHVEVEDTGIGISELEIAHLFEPFTQKDYSLTRKQGGTGLGLPICKRLIELMDGKIGARSRVGEGSTFWFNLPAVILTPDEYSGVVIQDTIDIDKARVLVVEDNPVNQEVIVSMLTGLGFQVSKADHGVQAVELLEQHHFDLVLMDCQMPTMDGYQATQEIRRREKDGRHTPIVAVTAHAMAGDRERCLAAGMDDYLPKPLNLDRLGDTLARWIAF